MGYIPTILCKYIQNNLEFQILVLKKVQLAYLSMFIQCSLASSHESNRVLEMSIL